MPARPAEAAGTATPVDRALPTLVGIWAVGVLALSARLIAAMIWIRRLRRVHTEPAAERWQSRFTRLVERAAIARTIELHVSRIVSSPVTIGWLRPLVVVPISVLAGLSPAQLDALLCHELAHIRRRDYLVNLLQSVAESVLFFNPAVWYLSHRVRVEREHCCDAAAVAMGS